MARTYSPTAKPLVSRGYGNLVVLTFLAILIGCGLIAWEIWGYGGYGSMKATKPVIEKVVPLPPAGKPGPAPKPAPGPVVPPGGGM